MPIDQKRINGPDASTPYDIYIHSEVKDNAIQANALERHDGRSNKELRNICKVEVKSHVQQALFREILIKI